MIDNFAARLFENRYLRTTWQRSLTGHWPIEVVLEERHFCSEKTYETGRYDAFQEGLQNSKASRSPSMNRRLDHPVTECHIALKG